MRKLPQVRPSQTRRLDRDQTPSTEWNRLRQIAALIKSRRRTHPCLNQTGARSAHEVQIVVQVRPRQTRRLGGDQTPSTERNRLRKPSQVRPSQTRRLGGDQTPRTERNRLRQLPQVRPSQTRRLGGEATWEPPPALGATQTGTPPQPSASKKSLKGRRPVSKSNLTL